MTIKILSIKKKGVSPQSENLWIRFEIDVVDKGQQRQKLTYFASPNAIKLKEGDVVDGVIEKSANPTYNPKFTPNYMVCKTDGFPVWSEDEIREAMKENDIREQLIYWEAVGKIASMGMGNFMSDDMEKYKVRWADFALFVDKFIQERLK